MFLKLGILILVATTIASQIEESDKPGDNIPNTQLKTTFKAAAPYKFYDEKAKFVAERMESMPIRLNEILTVIINNYKRVEKLDEAIEIYKASANLVSGTECQLDENKYDKSFDEAVVNCASVAITKSAKESFDWSLDRAVMEVKFSDQTLQRLTLPEDDPLRKKLRLNATQCRTKIKTALGRVLKQFQKAILATKLKAKGCIDTAMIILMKKINESISGNSNLCP